MFVRVDAGPDRRTPGIGLLYLKLVLTAAFWGGTFVAGRVIAQEVPPFSAAFLRFAIASGVLLVFAARRLGRFPVPERRELGVALLLGATGVLAYNAFFFLGLRTVEAGRASLIIANNPVFIALFSALLFRERLGRVGAAGIGFALLGAAVVISRGDPGALLAGGFRPGDGYILGCVASWVAYTLVGKVALRRLSPLVAVFYSCAAGTVLLAVPAWGEGLFDGGAAYSARAWLGIAYLGYCGSALAFNWYYQGIERLGPSRAGVFINFVPVTGVVLGFVLLGEPLDPSLLFGGGLVLAGVWLTNRSRRGTGGVRDPVQRPVPEPAVGAGPGRPS